MTRARDNSFNPFNNQYAGKNLVINGGMDIWQRGTSIPLTTSSYTADRWFGYRFLGGATVSRQATGDPTNLPNIQYCLRVQRDSGNTSTNVIGLSYNFETVNSIPLVGKTVTLSFYARAGANFSQSGNTIQFNITSGTGTDQCLTLIYTNYNTFAFVNASLTTTWQRFTCTGVVPANANELAIGIGNFAPTGTAGANDYFEFTGVQIEVGSVATPFSRSGGTIGGELSLCQRYYEKTFDTDFVPANGSTSTTFSSENGVTQLYNAGATGNESSHIKFSVPKRTAPSLLFFGNSSGLWLNPSNNTSPAMGTRNIGQTGFSAYQQISGSYGSIRGHWTASAEL